MPKMMLACGGGAPPADFAQIGHEIANARHAGGYQQRIACRVSEFVDPPGLESGIECDLGRSNAAARRHE